MRRIITSIFFIGLVVTSSGVTKKQKKIEYKKLSHEEKSKKERGLTFKLTFDKNTINPEYAEGEAAPKQGGNIELGLRGMLGYDGKNAFKKESGEKLRFNVAGNVDHKKGTIIFWVKAENYSPKDIKREDPENCHKGYIYIKFNRGDEWGKGEEWIKMFFYQYWNSNVAYFYWNNSYPKSMGGWKIAPISLSNISKGEWFQIAATWDEKEIKTYLNGVFQGKIGLPEKAKKTLSMKPDKEGSYISIRECLFGPKDLKFGKNTIIDDISIYNYPMSDLAIKKKFSSLVNSIKEIELPNVALTFNGIDDGSGRINKLEVEMDFNALPEEFLNLLEQGKLKAKYEFIKKDDSSKTMNNWTLNKVTEKRILTLKKGGIYLFKLTLEAPDGKQENVSEEFEVPDLMFAGNQLGKDDSVPKPWTPVRLSDNGVVSIWNRTYLFRDGPLPYQIKVAGKELLKKPPELIIKTTTGIEKVKYSIINKEVTDSKVIFKGTGEAAGFTIDFKTTIEYDGLINCEFTINGSPEIESMKATWAVNPGFDKYFLSPLLNHDKQAEYEFPGSDWKCVRQLWVASEKGGFCWAPSSDANWVFKTGEKVIKIDRKKDGAFCEIDMINKKVKLPPQTPYQLLFIATPTRPAPDKLYSAHLGWNKALLSTKGEGQAAFGEFAPDPVDFTELVKNREKNSVAMYNFAEALTDSSFTGRYFAKYWEIPGAYVYAMRFKHHGKVTSTTTISTCPTTTYSDFILSNIKKLLDHKDGDRMWAIYYDLCGISPCCNELHGCTFKDKFGRTINKSLLLGLREHLKRTTKYCHSRGRETIYHAQNVFNPMVHGFGDYWFSGEQFRGKITRNRFAYCDEISDNIYRSEFNRRILGSALLFLPSLIGKNCTDEATLAMFTQLLIQDIPSSTSFNKYWVAKKVFKIMDKYDLDNSVVNRYYEQDKITSSNPDVRITYYMCKDGRYLVVLGNVTAKEQDAVIDFSKLQDVDLNVQAEFAEKSLKMKDSRLNVKIPPRMFMLLGLNKKEKATNK